MDGFRRFYLRRAASGYLIFSSDYVPTKGSFNVEAASETEPPVPTPEPRQHLALFGIASALYAAKRRRKSQAGIE